MSAVHRWFLDHYRDAVWESEHLTASHKAVAEAYARHARDPHGNKTATADLAWITYDRLQTAAGIRRRATVTKILAELETLGWLTAVRRVHRRPTMYRLTIPHNGSNDTTDARQGTTVVPPPVPHRHHRSSHHPHHTPPRSTDAGTPPLEDPPSNTSPSSSARPADRRRIADAAGATDAEVNAIIDKITRENTIRRPFSVYLRAIPDTDLRAHLVALRTPTPDQQNAAFEHLRHAAPDCIHGTPAGALTRPTTNTKLCPLCQRGLPAVPHNTGRPDAGRVG
ncbi:hypothetical protein Lfu02_41330 [Longispora fulva]|uniref:Uncharacterized protein n=1 Tax=Longispora fulva TaxID=619741 RepID=A0A8J7KWH9_9ACTN|nr:hypothetical protein [Longispora fulva]MBG6136592.1 hypothetical protein [Longispora fulva]GIG59761.1 hypothetical protein Lfu02_41330 [Longispora fulva]